MAATKACLAQFLLLIALSSEQTGSMYVRPGSPPFYHPVPQPPHYDPCPLMERRFAEQYRCFDPSTVSTEMCAVLAGIMDRLGCDLSE